MDYLCLLYFDGKQLDAMPADEKKTIDRGLVG